MQASNNPAQASASPKPESEIQQLVALMHQLEDQFSESGLVGSGWQVAPRAMVSTANLLRVGDRYTIIDLESGIPAVLVPRYLIAGARRGALPPFDDLDPDRLKNWLIQHDRLLTFRLGPRRLEQLRTDVDCLLHHSEQWKASELAVFRRPWRLWDSQTFAAYRQEYRLQRVQEGIVDAATARQLDDRSPKMRLLWWLGLMPSKLASPAQKWVANESFRCRVKQWASSRQVRQAARKQWCQRKRDQLIADQNCPQNWNPQLTGLLGHLGLAKLLPARMHRLISDPQRRRNQMTRAALLVISPTFQSWAGQDWVEQAIKRWHDEQRLDDDERRFLEQELSGDVVRLHVRGFALHLALKTLAPLWVPIKLAGFAAFAITVNPLYLLPFLITPALRFLVTLQSRSIDRHNGISHAKAMWIGWLPTIGLVAFPLQLMAIRPAMSTFLIRDIASRIGRRVPIYGGKDSRTEIALIEWTDALIKMTTGVFSSLSKWFPCRTSEHPASPLSADSTRPVSNTLPMHPKPSWRQKIESQAKSEIAKIIAEREQENAPDKRPDGFKRVA